MLFNDERLAFRNGDSSTLSVGDWFKFSLLGLLNVIPFVGSIAYLVLVIVIAANRETAPSLRNFIIVSIIWIAIYLVLLLVAAILAAAGVIALPHVAVN